MLTQHLSQKKISKKDFDWSLKRLSLILQPFLPHISEEIWSKLNNKSLCINEIWPEEKNILKETELSIAVQINGKTRHIMKFENSISKDNILEIVKENEKIEKYIKGKKILREIYVPGKIVNLVL